MYSNSDVESTAGSDHAAEPDPERGEVKSAEVTDQEMAYTVKVGARLRAIRRQKSYSLQHVEAISREEFKASVLGAYERGERAISVPRLQRLARLYQVPVDQMLPAGDPDAPAVEPPSDDGELDLANSGRARGRDEQPVTIDLTAIEHLNGPEIEMIARYLRMIQIQRGDYNGKMLTIRREDLRAVACVLNCHPDEVPVHLTRLGLSLVR
jgi:transcriptional regulator with XRE-family HTH domain